MKSVFYEGTLAHRRVGSPDHAFRYPMAMPLLDLAELDRVFAQHPLWSIARPNAIAFRRADYLGDPRVRLDEAVRELVEARTGNRPRGPIRLLTQVRTWGWLFNPLSVYLCMDPTDAVIEALVLEVTNTPWHERHAYVLRGGAGEHWFAKELHVSPFFGMDQHYRLRLSPPGERFVIDLATVEHGKVMFEAVLSLRRRAMTRAAMGRLLWRYPVLTLRVSLGIYWQAVRLWRKGARLHPHPTRSRPVEQPKAA